jgi:hypothetical protein
MQGPSGKGAACGTLQTAGRRSVRRMSMLLRLLMGKDGGAV